MRHSGARHATVELACRDGEVRIAVDDDGRGFDVEAARGRGLRGRSLGLVGMQERAALAGGSLTLESRPGRGTRVEARFPPPVRGDAA
ncbi:Signal transduction histidine-protein kinase/phosphatase DegS [compost metagenome]